MDVAEFVVVLKVLWFWRWFWRCALPGHRTPNPRGCSEWSHLSKISVNSAPIENQEYLHPVVFCSISPIEISALQILSQSKTRNLTELQALTDVFSRSSRIVPDPLKHKFRVAWWGWFLWNPKKDIEMIWLPMISQTSSSPTARRNPYTCQNISKRLCFVPFLFF